jgi:hypothetical protein
MCLSFVLWQPGVAGKNETEKMEATMPVILWLLGVPLSLVLVLWLVGVV